MFLIALSYIRHDQIDAHIQKESTPSFQEVKLDVNHTETKLVFIDTETKLHGTIINSGKRSEFYRSSIVINDKTEFSNNYAFCAGSAAGIGGAIFISFSMLTCGENVESIIFKKNEASVGGGIASLSSAVYLDKVTFSGNTAFKYGGAIYYQGFVPSLITTPPGAMKIVTQDCTFRNNAAYELGGAVAAFHALEVYQERSLITKNSANLAGAGMYISNTENIKLYQCYIYSNLIKSSLYRQFGNENPFSSKSKGLQLHELQDLPAPTFSYRGGSGLFVASNSNSGRKDIQTVIYTHHNCISGNNPGTTVSLQDKTGNDILFVGSIKWTSYEDNINGINSTDDMNNIVFFSNETSKGETEFIKLNSASIVEKCNGNTDYAAAKPITVGPKKVNRQVPNNDAVDKTSEIPNPTKFTYVATPITKYTKPYSEKVKFDIDEEFPFNPITQAPYSETNSVSNNSVESSKPTEGQNAANPRKKTSIIWIIVGCVCGAILIGLILAFFIIRSRKSNEEEDTKSSCEMVEETVISSIRANDLAVTIDNPLWTTSTQDNDNSDPFRTEFEEKRMVFNFNL